MDPVNFVTSPRVILKDQPSPFSGCTALWITNPTDFVPYVGDTCLLSRTPGGEPLYDRLWESVDGPIGQLMWDRYLLSRLPARTAHITLCDLIHNENIYQLNSSAKSMMQGVLANLPGSATAALPVPLPPTSGLQPVTFCFDKLALWGSVLVARLKPAEDSVAAFEMACLWRTKLDQAWVDLGKKPLSKYTPHISIGYFANEALAHDAHTSVQVWSEHLQHMLNGIDITTTSARLTFFTDMWTFFVP